MRSLINITDLSVKEIEELINVANDIIANPEKYREKWLKDLQGKRS